jgi:hypothetical protein
VPIIRVIAGRARPRKGAPMPQLHRALAQSTPRRLIVSGVADQRAARLGTEPVAFTMPPLLL